MEFYTFSNPEEDFMISLTMVCQLTFIIFNSRTRSMKPYIFDNAKEIIEPNFNAVTIADICQEKPFLITSRTKKCLQFLKNDSDQ